MKPAGMADTPEVDEVISMADRLSATERLFIARWLLDSILHVDTDDDVAWGQLSLSAFEQDWDNDDDAIYDDWRKHYGVPAG